MSVYRGSNVSLPKIVIQTDADFTPKGKRRVRIVRTTRGRQVRCYVSGRIYAQGWTIEKALAWLASANEN